ncbi:MAG: hypothetical protein KDA44_15095 [Planctomycetales bacterium]|nr:hypothetical protein [Planctomycetales bacterium]
MNPTPKTVLRPAFARSIRRLFRQYFLTTLQAARFLVLAMLLVGGESKGFAQGARERISIHAGWRFSLGDPAGTNSEELLYDARPTDEREDESQRRAEDTAAAREVGPVTYRVLKPWILPTANRFIHDAAQRHARPAGDTGSNLPYVQLDFDDSGWTPVTLPHDWAISGPINSDGTGGGMGRLPNPGIGWYRRRLEVPAEDAGRFFFLDVDGAMSYSAAFPAADRKAFGGLALAIIRAIPGAPGAITVTGQSDGLEDGRIEIHSERTPRTADDLTRK